MAAATPTTSAIESKAPTSWNPTRSIFVPCSFASTAAMRAKMSPASARASGSRRARFKQPFDLGVVAVLVVVVVVVSRGRERVRVRVRVRGRGGGLRGRGAWLFWPGQVTSKLLPTKAPRLRLPKATRRPRDAHRLDGGGHDGGGDAEIDERGHRHVARDAGAGLEVQVQAAQRLHRSRFRLSIAAIWPAPKPLSMFTTAMPAAHELSIDSSAAKPPRFAP